VLVCLLLLEFCLAAFEFFAPMTVDNNNEIQLIRGEVQRVQKKESIVNRFYEWNECNVDSDSKHFQTRPFFVITDSLALYTRTEKISNSRLAFPFHS